MRISIKWFLSFMFLMVISAVLLVYCGRNEKQDSVRSQFKDSTMVIRQKETSGVRGLEKHTVEVESRLEDLLSLIEEREKGLLTKEAELTERENRIARLHLISWIIFGIGVGSIVMTLIVGIMRKRKNKLKTDVKGIYLKKNWITNMEVKLRGIQVKIDQLKEKADKARAEVRVDYLETIRDLQVKLDTLHKKMNELVQSEGEIWDDIQKGVKESFKDLKIELKSASRKIK